MDKKNLKFTIPIVLFVLTIVLVLNNRPDDAFTTFFLMFGYIFFFIIFKRDGLEDDEDTGDTTISSKRNISKTPYYVYYGDELNFSDEELTRILNKRFPYFNKLDQIQKNIFLERLQKFIAAKTFKIHEGNGFKEMPVLISAAAIQLTFGLKKYLLPHFEFIHIYPQEFMRVRPIICFLEGNVSGQAINLSWKHFLEGYANSNDGQNVGLHELAHALYYQTFVVEENVDKNFRDQYDEFITDSNKAYHTEKSSTGGLYSEYAEKNSQEFWAESIELFFEKPADMNRTYPRLYSSLKNLLNQDPLNKTASMTG